AAGVARLRRVVARAGPGGRPAGRDAGGRGGECRGARGRPGARGERGARARPDPRRPGRLQAGARSRPRTLRDPHPAGRYAAARPGDALALAGRARVAEDRGDLAGAIAFWDRYLAIKPDEEAGALRRQELRELKAAIAALRETAARAPGAAIFSELGRLLAVAGDAPAAARA